MSGFDDFIAGFGEEPGYLDYGRVGPLSRAVQAEASGAADTLARARFGSLDTLDAEDERMRRAAAALSGFAAEQIVFQPSTSQGLMHAVFGLTGGLLLSAAEFPSLPFAATRAAQALHAVTPVWLQPEHGQVTPGTIREQLSDDVTAVAVSLVDSRTGYLADIEGIRQVIRERMLIVDAVQGFGVVDAPYGAADVLVTGGQKWLRAGWGTGFLALSERAAAELVPVFSGWTGTDEPSPYDVVPDPARAAQAFQLTNPDRVAQARLAAALEDVATAGIAEVRAALEANVDRATQLADEFAVPVVSSRAPHERAGIVVLQPAPERLTALAAALFNHGVTTTGRGATIRLSVHAGTTDETLGMLRAAFVAYASGY